MRRLRLITTGGTIAMKIDAAKAAPVPALTGRDLLDAVPGLAEIAGVEVVDLFNLPSVEMDAERWRVLRAAVVSALQRDDLDGVIVSHGTDTLEESAWFLELTVNSEKPVALVGAQRNASEADFDGPRNLLCAARFCTAEAARGLGVVVVMNGEVHAARDVVKWHTTNVDGFHSGGPGMLGTVDSAGRVVIRRAPQAQRARFQIQPRALPVVEIVPTYAGASGWQLRAAVERGAAGVVLQALGAGNVTRACHDEAAQALYRGVAVVIATRVPNGGVQPLYGFVGGGKTLQQAGAVFAGDLTAQKARISLMLALHAGVPPGNLQSVFTG